MRLLDANILLYAYNRDAEHHAICRQWLEDALNGHEPVALPWQTMLAFVRIATNPRAMLKPLLMVDALRLVTSWLEHPRIVVPAAGDRFWDLLQQQIAEGRATGPLVTDAALAALAVEQGATLCSTDRDFRRFGGLKLENPVG